MLFDYHNVTETRFILLYLMNNNDFLFFSSIDFQFHFYAPVLHLQEQAERVRAADDEMEREREKEAIELSLRLSRCAFTYFTINKREGGHIFVSSTDMKRPL